MGYLEKYHKEVDDFLWVCRMLSERMYVTSHGGNLCWRLEDNLLLITPTKMYKADIRRKSQPVRHQCTSTSSDTVPM